MQRVCLCKECDHNLCKPDYNLSIKFKIQLVAMLVADHCKLYCKKYFTEYFELFSVSLNSYCLLSVFHVFLQLSAAL